MPDLDVQIRHYMDTISEPLTVDDVLATESLEQARPPSVHRLRSQPLSTMQARRRAWIAATGAAAATLVLIGGIALLTRGGGDSEPADRQTTTSQPVATTTVVASTSPPTTTVPPSSPSGVVAAAFAALHDGDWNGFLGYLASDGAVRTPSGFEPFAEPTSIEFEGEQRPFDFDDNGSVNRAELLVVEAQYLALSEIVVEGCEPDPGGVLCLLQDNSIYHRAVGVEPNAIPVLVQDGRIVEIRIAGREPPLGGCSEPCTWDPSVWEDFESIWGDVSNAYSEWLEQEELPDPLVWVPLTDGTGFGWLPWIETESLASYRDGLTQFLADESTGTGSKALIEGYVASLALHDSAPEPLFDVSELGTEQPLVGLYRGRHESPLTDGGLSGPAALLVQVTIDDGPLAEYAIKTTDAGIFYSAGVWLSIDGGAFDRSVEPPNFLVAAQAVRSESISYVAIGGLPAETSVVTATLSDGTRVWQQPFGGMVLFNSGTDLELTFDVLDAMGKAILEVEVWIPDAARPDGYLALPVD